MKKFLLIAFAFFAFTSHAQTVSAPELNCVTIVGNDVVLSWINPVVTCGPFNAYYIYYSTNINGPYLLLATITNQFQTQFTHAGAAGTVYYYYMVSDFNCPGATFLNSDTLDTLDPLAPEVQYVSVGDSGQTIFWYWSDSPETYGYIIYVFMNGNYIPIDTLFDDSVYIYTDTISNVNPDTGAVYYSVAAFDSCFNTGTIYQPPHHSIFLQVQPPGICQQYIELEWTPYENWIGGPYPGGASTYHIYAGASETSTYFIGNVDGNLTNYSHLNTLPYDTVCFTVFGISAISGWIAESNTVCVPTNNFNGANDFYIHNVSVDTGSGAVDIFYSMQPTADIVNLQLQRSTDNFNYSTIVQFPAPADLTIINSYTDATANTSSQSYYYRLLATDSCGRRDTSTVGRTILLLGYAFSDFTNYVAWNPSYIDYASVVGYDVNHNIGMGYETVTFTGNTFFEEQIIQPEETPCYFVEAKDTLIFPNGETEVVYSTSNQICLYAAAQVIAPNAFAPEGVNNVFLPLIFAEDYSAYVFSVYNRWGELIFQSNDITQGWDGKHDGKLVPQGAYAWTVSLVEGGGSRKLEKGMVLVVR
jgi:gliding motility-associated-like protein